MIWKINILHFHIIILICVMNNNFNSCDGKQTVLFLQRPVIVYYNTSYVQNLTLTMKTYNRTHPLKFVTMNADVAHPLDNTIRFHFYLYELLSNVYKRSFVEYHVGLCDGFKNDILISSMINEAYYRIPETERPMKILSCPLTPGHYELKDLKLNLIHLPTVFPFVEGRIYVNATHSGRLAFSVYFDLTIKTLRQKIR